jgi:hypothetical protein
VEPGFAWLEIAAIDEYVEVASSTELCVKCHAEVDVPDHQPVLADGPMASFLCTDCHDAHDTAASCTSAGCHDDLLAAAAPAPGHDEDHQAVACVACHDASNLEVGPSEDQGIWITLPYTSHSIQSEAPCDRCHFANNPWDLAEDVSSD